MIHTLKAYFPPQMICEVIWLEGERGEQYKNFIYICVLVSSKRNSDWVGRFKQKHPEMEYAKFSADLRTKDPPQG